MDKIKSGVIGLNAILNGGINKNSTSVVIVMVSGMMTCGRHQSSRLLILTQME